MPLVNVKLIEGVFTSAQKQEMIRKLTDTMVSIEGENNAPGDDGYNRGGQERRLGDRRQLLNHGRREGPGGWQVQKLAPYRSSWDDGASIRPSFPDAPRPGP